MPAFLVNQVEHNEGTNSVVLEAVSRNAVVPVKNSGIIAVHVLQAKLSAEQDRHYSSLGAVPGNNLELQAVDEERFTAAALFGLAGSEQGLDVLLRHPGQVLTGTTCQACIHTSAINSTRSDRHDTLTQHCSIDSPACRTTQLAPLKLGM